uniref:C2 domain-containing protein n=1 Tax=Ciona intestinalis TaxID=7719 RepID=H2XZB8_CIOIN
FIVVYSTRRSILTINIVECRNLVSFPHKKCDAYVKCYLTPDRSVKKKTSIKKNTLSPKFNQELKFSNITMAELSSRVLEMSVWNAGTFGKKIFIGHVQISLDNWKWTNTPHWYPLKPKECTTCNLQSQHDDTHDAIKLPYTPAAVEEGNVKVTSNVDMVCPAREVNEIELQDIETYVKCYMLPDKSHRSKMRSTIIKSTNSPRYNHNFVFRGFNKSELMERCIEIMVVGVGSAGSRRKSNTVGGIRLSSGERKHIGKPAEWMDSNAEERELWMKSLSAPGMETISIIPLRSHIKPTCSYS